MMIRIKYGKYNNRIGQGKGGGESTLSTVSNCNSSMTNWVQLNGVFDTIASQNSPASSAYEVGGSRSDCTIEAMR